MSSIAHDRPCTNRGLHLVSTRRLEEIRRRYGAYRDRLDRDRHAWPKPETAIAHVDDVLAEIDAALAARDPLAFRRRRLRLWRAAPATIGGAR